MSACNAYGGHTYGDTVLNSSFVHQGDYYFHESDSLKPNFFRTTNYEATKNVNAKRIRGTCQWVLTHRHYNQWRSSPSANILWISADPGCGKSTLSRALIDEGLASTPRNNGDPAPVLYFFFKDVDEQSYATTAICALLHQLYCIPGVWKTCEALVKQEYAEEGVALKSCLPKLWRLLLNSVAEANIGPVVCILDGLDECHQSQRQDFVQLLENLANLRCPPPFKVLVTSRPDLWVIRSFRHLVDQIPSIHLKGEDESEKLRVEIGLVIENIIKEISRRMALSTLVVEQLKDKLAKMQHRTYLWLAFVLEGMQRMAGPTDCELLRHIDNLPKNVEDAYERILDQSTQPEMAFRILSLLTVAGRPLTLDELELLLKVDESCRGVADIDLSGRARFREAIRDACGSFVFVSDGRVYLIHQTAKEFLFGQANTSPSQSRWKGCIIPSFANEEMAKKCLYVLCLARYWGNDLHEALGQNAALRYPFERWLWHLRDCPHNPDQSFLQAFVYFSSNVLCTKTNGLLLFKAQQCMGVAWDGLKTVYTSPLLTRPYNRSQIVKELDTLLLDEKSLEEVRRLQQAKSLQHARSLQQDDDESALVLTGKAIVQATLYAVDCILFKILDLVNTENPMMSYHIAIACRIAILWGGVCQLQHLLRRCSWMTSALDCKGRTLLSYAIEFGIKYGEYQSQTLIALIDAGARVEGDLHSSEVLTRSSDIHLLLQAGLDPFRGYLWHIAMSDNCSILESIIQVDSLRRTFINGFTTHGKCGHGRDFWDNTTEDCGSILDHINSVLFRILGLGRTGPCQPLVELAGQIEPRIGKLCLFCYVFNFQRGSKTYRCSVSPSKCCSMILDGQARAPTIREGLSGVQGHYRCRGFGPLVIAADCGDVDAGMVFLRWLEQSDGVHKVKSLAALRWSTLFAVLHDHQQFMTLLLSFTHSQPLKLSMGPNAQDLPPGLIEACGWRATKFKTVSSNAQLHQAWTRIDIEHASLLLKWSLEVTLALVGKIDLESMPRRIFDHAAMERLRFCVRVSKCEKLVRDVRPFVHLRASTDQRYATLRPHFDELIDHLLPRLP